MRVRADSAAVDMQVRALVAAVAQTQKYHYMAVLNVHGI
jgi:hypothetical protein